MGLVPTIRTPLTMAEVRPILQRAFFEKTGKRIGRAEPYLMAMVALENAHGQSIYNHDWGNVITYSPDQDYFMLKDRTTGKFNPRHFRDLPSHKAGAEYFVETLNTATNKRIVDAAFDDDFEAFFRGIHDISPITQRAYNHLAEGSSVRQAAKDTYRRLVNEFREPIVVTAEPTSSRKPNTSKTTGSKKTSNDGGALAVVILLAGVGGIYYASRHPKLRKHFR